MTSTLRNTRALGGTGLRSPNICGNDPGGRHVVMFFSNILFCSQEFFCIWSRGLVSILLLSLRLPTSYGSETTQSASRLRRVVLPAAEAVRLDSLRFDTLKRRRRIL